MMSTTKPKSKKTAAEPLEIEPSIQQEGSKKVSKKSSIAKSGAAIETKEAVVAVEKEVKPSGKKSKIVKAKVIRDSFSFPEQDYLKISELKKTCLAEGLHVKKGEILRAGLLMLTKLNLAELKQAIEQVEKVQTGRPSSSKI
jgi:hypothetical protein